MSIKKDANHETGSVSFDFGNGRSFTATLANLPDNIKQALMVHGLSQKLGDSYSGALKAVSDGEADTVEQYAEECVQSVYATLQAGQWSATRTGGGSAPRTPMVVEAIARVQGIAIEAAQAAYDRLTEDQAKQLARIQAVKDAVAIIKAERAAARAEAAKARAGQGGEDLGAILGL